MLFQPVTAYNSTFICPLFFYGLYICTASILPSKVNLAIIHNLLIMVEILGCLIKLCLKFQFMDRMNFCMWGLLTIA